MWPAPNWEPPDISGLYNWEKTPSNKPLDLIIFNGYDTWDEVRSACHKRTEPYWQGACAARHYDLGFCVIHHKKDDFSQYLEWHERKHCAGYDHLQP